MTRTAAASRCAASCRGGSAVTAASTSPVEVGDHRRRAPLAQPGLQPVRRRANQPTAPPESTAGPTSGDTVRDPGSVMTPATMCASTHGRRDRAAGDHHAAAHRCGEVAPHRRRGATARFTPRAGRRTVRSDAGIRVSRDALPEHPIRPCLVADDERGEDQRRPGHDLQRVAGRRRVVDRQAPLGVQRRGHQVRIQRAEQQDDHGGHHDRACRRTPSRRAARPHQHHGRSAARPPRRRAPTRSSPCRAPAASTARSRPPAR